MIGIRRSTALAMMSVRRLGLAGLREARIGQRRREQHRLVARELGRALVEIMLARRLGPEDAGARTGRR